MTAQGYALVICCILVLVIPCIVVLCLGAVIKGQQGVK